MGAGSTPLTPVLSEGQVHFKSVSLTKAETPTALGESGNRSASCDHKPCCFMSVFDGTVVYNPPLSSLSYH